MQLPVIEFLIVIRAVLLAVLLAACLMMVIQAELKQTPGLQPVCRVIVR